MTTLLFFYITVKWIETCKPLLTSLFMFFSIKADKEEQNSVGKNSEQLEDFCPKLDERIPLRLLYTLPVEGVTLLSSMLHNNVFEKEENKKTVTILLAITASRDLIWGKLRLASGALSDSRFCVLSTYSVASSSTQFRLLRHSFGIWR